MTKKANSGLLEGELTCLELLGESDTLFAYVVIPVLCIIVVYFLGTALCQLWVDAHPAGASTASDLLSIDPDKWIPRS